MPEYIIQGETMKALAGQARRLKGATEEMTAVEIAEVFSRTQGSVKESGAHKIEAVAAWGSVLKSGQYDEGEIFALPVPEESMDRVFQGWSAPVPLKKGFLITENRPITAGGVYAPADGVRTAIITVPSGGATFTFDSYVGASSVDWGDGTVSDYSDNIWQTKSHTYAEGFYTVKIHTSAYGRCGGADEASKAMLEAVWFSPKDEDCYGACEGQSGLRHVMLPNGVKKLRNKTFYNCASLECVVIPETVSLIEEQAFYGCASLVKCVLPYGITDIPSHMFQYCTRLEGITIPDTVAAIGKRAFSDCTSLKSISIPSGVPAIGAYTFCECTSLESITIPDTVTEIGDSAFCCLGIRGNNSLAEIVLPAVVSIGSLAFYGLYKLKTVVLGADSVCALVGSGTASPFYGTLYGVDCAIYVPDDLVDSYKADENWAAYANYIKPLSEYTEATATE